VNVAPPEKDFASWALDCAWMSDTRGTNANPPRARPKTAMAISASLRMNGMRSRVWFVGSIDTLPETGRRPAAGMICLS
jgi:hypothetical protein